MKKILFITNIANKVGNFSMAALIASKDLGGEFYIAANWQNADPTQIEKDEKKYDIKIKSVPISRNPLAKTNLIAYRELVSFVKKENIDYIHCNTPTGGILGRLVGKKCKVKKVIYQAHGFHFYKGAPIINWLVYFPLEWICSFLTDVLIAINKEDFDFSKKFMKAKKIEYIHGVGVDTTKFSDAKCDKKAKFQELGLPEKAIMLLSVGEINKNKNHEIVIRAIERISKNNKNIHYVLAGVGNKEEELKRLIRDLGLDNRVHFLGYRSDIPELCNVADIFCFPSLREGLPVSLMEAMAAGLPVVCSEIRGNTDLIQNGQGGFLCKPDDVDGFAKRINELLQNEELRRKMSSVNLENIKQFDIVNVTMEIKKIYEDVLRDEK